MALRVQDGARAGAPDPPLSRRSTAGAGGPQPGQLGGGEGSGAYQALDARAVCAMHLLVLTALPDEAPGSLVLKEANAAAGGSAAVQAALRLVLVSALHCHAALCCDMCAQARASRALGR